MTLRTAADIQAEYTAVRAAYLRSLSQSQGSTSTGSGSVSFTRPSPDVLRAQMLALAAELRQLNAGGIVIVGGVPDE